ncbi:glutaminyl-peptide cyclotransferase [Agaribacterium haliotis]|uniref:glutaminyl-peptide cyclotransferase n=1 Tax=Agaribacterium haliotis TaxID=2013869 RepID=UPI001303FDC3|nr:glutaminyl-peptide cyclotransferase [Agaribacterium haliotis]
MFRKVFIAIVVAAASSLASASERTGKTDHNWQLIDQQRSDQHCFTQGFTLIDGIFFSSCGGYGQSYLSASPLQGNRQKQVQLPRSIFAEGLTEHRGQLYLLSWKQRQAFKFSKELKLLERYHYNREGWGLSSNGEHLIASDGSHHLYFLDPASFATVKKIAVQYRGKALPNINELEWVNGYLWANVWHDPHIYQIDVERAEAIERWDMSALTPAQQSHNREAVLNGIAWDKQRRAFWLTGKLWPKRYLVQLLSN